MVNGAEEAFAGTVTVAGTEATRGFELARLMTIPPAGAIPTRLIAFPVLTMPPLRADGVTTTVLSLAGNRLSVALAATPLRPLRLAKMVTVVDDATVEVLMLKLGDEVVPAAMVTVAGAEAKAGLELVKLKTRSLWAGAPVRIKVSCTGFPL